MAPHGSSHASKSPSSTKSSPKDARSEPGPPLFALLLNCETKDESEELLDYSYPSDAPDLQRITPMKGVFIASCGVMRAAAGQDATIFVFWAEDGSRQFKASMRRVERWLLCIVLPGSASDRIAEFFGDLAAGLVALRHGRLSSLQGHFRQLDRIFRALGSVWTTIQHLDDEVAVSSGLLYACLGVVPLSSLAELWSREVSYRIGEWERKWEATTQEHSLARPEGFALFMGQTLMATSLSDGSFEACLRLCVLEGVLDSDGAQGAGKDDGSCDVRCHSLFLRCDSDEANALPSHQYSVLRHGPWLLFMLWQMAAAEQPVAASPRTPVAGCSAFFEAASPKTPAKALIQGSDPFGVDLCSELLGSLPMPDPRSISKACAAGPRHGTPRTSGRESRRAFGLPCPAVFKPASRKSKSGRHQADGDHLPPRPAEPHRPTFYALEMPELSRPPEPDTPLRFGTLQQPSRAAREGLSEAVRLMCPEMGPRAGRRRCEWMPWAPRELVGEWSELEWLARTHQERRASWQDAPSPSLSRHALLRAIKDKSDFERMWDECLEESSLAMPMTAKRSDAVHLGDGQPWRFQVGAPFHMSDVPPLISAGALTGGGHGRAWSAISTSCSRDKGRAPTGRRVLLNVAAAEEVS